MPKILSHAIRTVLLTLTAGAATYSVCAYSVPPGDPDREENQLSTVTVTGTREQSPLTETPAAVSRIDGEEVDATKPAHPAEIMGRVPGVHVNVTNGEGHMTAIRQPITTQAVYLYLEDGIPIRSTGFFNHNALYEVNLPRAAGIEVTRGPGTALYGSDAMGGVVNVLSRPSPSRLEYELNLEAGAYGWRRLLAGGGNSWRGHGLRVDANITHTDGWRDGTDYDRGSLNLRWDAMFGDGATLKTILAASEIDQRTAGSSRVSAFDYRHKPTRNYFPISYREVSALRVSTSYEAEGDNHLFSFTPYVRGNAMEYMPNWSFTYDPSIKRTENDSYGALVKFRWDPPGTRTRLIVGADLDMSPGAREEHSINAVKQGDVYTDYSLGPRIYDYDVTFQGVSPYLHVESSLTSDVRLIAGLRYDDMRYDYDNRMADGPLKVLPKPSSMGFPPTYNHPADSKVKFHHLSPKLGVTWRLNETHSVYAAYNHAFRAPSEGELFRPGSSAESLSLRPVKARSYEVGMRAMPTEGVYYELAAYRMVKDDDLVSYTDPVTTDRYTANAGETLHQGLEALLDIRLAEDWRLNLAYSYARHRYEDWVEKGSDFSGNEIASAPRHILNTRLTWRPGLLRGGRVELEWEKISAYWMDQANTARYDGHDLFNLRANYPVAREWDIYARVMNLTQRRYATAAALSGGEEQFAPGMPRTVYLGVNYRF